ncbi:hypothetical protein [Streptosporangium sp. OZ121]|uniref:hypothetical protein n=1 Tax=Streptosporangium sp. OZ121 TaxID=3444183 RepID=UPI003F7A98AC
MKDAGLPAKDWTPREMRHSFVSLLSDSGVPLEDIARLVGHRGTAVTGAGLPEADPPGPARRGGGDGPDLHVTGAIVTQLATQNEERVPPFRVTPLPTS